MLPSTKFTMHIALIYGSIYILWLPLHVTGYAGAIFYLLELAVFSLYVLFYINHTSRRYQLYGGNYSIRAIVDVFILTKNENIEMVEATLRAAYNIHYPNKRIYLMDDGARNEMNVLAEKYGASYISREDRLTKAYKAASLNYTLKKSFGNFVLVLDADQVSRPNILDDLLGHFNDEKVGLVATKQEFNVSENDFNNDRLFYDFMQAGKNADDLGMSCGSGVIYRRSALEKIGGFSEWNLLEDLTTTFEMNTRGYKTIYISQGYTRGDAPLDLKTIYKQRGAWALDTFRLFIWKLPLFNKNLNWRQRLHYFEMGYIYLVSAIIVPAIFASIFYSLAFNRLLVDSTSWYLIFRIPSFLLIIFVYTRLEQGRESSRMWAALFPVYIRALYFALLYKKPTYLVTEKNVAPTWGLSLIIPQLLVIFFGLISVYIHIKLYGFTNLLIGNLFWLTIIIYWLGSVFPKAFYIKQWSFKARLQSLLQSRKVTGKFDRIYS